MCDLKVGVFSGPGCEKTSITLRYLKNEFVDTSIPTIEDEFSKVIEVNNKTINLNIIDTAGQDDFAEMRYCYYTKIQAALLVFDISNPQTIDNIKTIYEDIKDAAENDVIFAVAANRGYLRDENNNNELVSTAIYKDLEKYFNSKVFETNAKTGKNIEEIFQYIVKQYLLTIEKEKFPKNQKQRSSSTLLTTNIQNSSQDLLKKRSTSFVPKMMSKKKIIQESNENTTKDTSSSISVFGSEIGAEIKAILQSRTKQLQIALEDKKELEKKLLEKEEQLQKALERVKELERQLNINSDDNDDEPFSPKSRKKMRNSDLADYNEDSKIKKEKRRSLNANMSDYGINDDDQNELKNSKKESSAHLNMTDDCIQEEIYKKRKSHSKIHLSDDESKKHHRKSRKSDPSSIEKEAKKSPKKICPSKTEGDSSRLTLEKLKELARPNDIFQKKIRVFNPNEIDQLKKVKEIGRGDVDEVIKVTRKQIMAMIVFDSNSDNKVEKMLRQFEVLNQAKHPNIIKALGCCFGDENHKPSMLFEYISNNLRIFVKKLSNEEKISVIFEIADAMKQAHFYGVAHLNLNPDNVLIGSENHVKVADFGISSLVHCDSPESMEEKLASSSIFLPPEKIQSKNEISEELVDVYSFGVVLYFIISNGELPKIESNENGEANIDLSSFPDSFNEYSSAFVKKCCATNPDDRPSFADIVTALEESLDLIDGVDIAAIKKRIVQFQ